MTTGRTAEGKDTYTAVRKDGTNYLLETKEGKPIPVAFVRDPFAKFGETLCDGCGLRFQAGVGSIRAESGKPCFCPICANRLINNGR